MNKITIPDAVDALRRIPKQYDDLRNSTQDKRKIHDEIARAFNKVCAALSDLDLDAKGRPRDWELEPQLKAAYLEAEKVLNRAWRDCTGQLPLDAS